MAFVVECMLYLTIIPHDLRFSPNRGVVRPLCGQNKQRFDSNSNNLQSIMHCESPRKLFETTPENVLAHLKKIYAENELPESATTKEFLAVQTEGKRQVQRSILHYNLDAIQ